MQIRVKQVWTYELKPTDTLRTLQAFKEVCNQTGTTITLENKGGKLYAVRVEG